MTIQRAYVHDDWFREDLSWLPYQLRRENFKSVLMELYDFMFDINTKLVENGWSRLEDIIPAASLSGMLSPVLGSSLAKYSRSLVVNALDNGHPDLLPHGMYPNNYAQEATEGVEIKATNNTGGAVDMHSDRTGWLCVFVYTTETNKVLPVDERAPLEIVEVICGEAVKGGFRFNERGPRGTRTATLHEAGLAKWRKGWVYVSEEARTRRNGWWGKLPHEVRYGAVTTLESLFEL